SSAGAWAQPGESARLAERDFVPDPSAADRDHHRAGPALEDGPVRLAEAPLVVALDAEGFEHGGGHPGELRARVHEDGVQRPRLTRTGRVLDPDVDAEGSHFVGHDSS